MFLAQQFAAPETIPEMLEAWHLLVAVVSPFILGLATSDATRKHIKKALPVVAAIGATLLTRFLNTDLGGEVLLLIPIIGVGVEMAYRAYGMVVSLVKRGDYSLNDVLGPDFSAVDVIRTALNQA